MAQNGERQANGIATVFNLLYEMKNGLVQVKFFQLDGF